MKLLLGIGLFFILWVFLASSVEASWMNDWVEKELDDFLNQQDPKDYPKISSEAREIFFFLPKQKREIEPVKGAYLEHSKALEAHLIAVEKKKANFSFPWNPKFISVIFDAWMHEKCEKFLALNLVTQDEFSAMVKKAEKKAPKSLKDLQKNLVAFMDECVKSKGKGKDTKAYWKCNPAYPSGYLAGILVFGGIFSLCIGFLIVIWAKDKCGHSSKKKLHSK